MSTTSRLIAVACVALMAGARGLDATTYVPLSACESFWTADAVFVGTIRKQPEEEMRTFDDSPRSTS
jgi:hypothetical protein